MFYLFSRDPGRVSGRSGGKAGRSRILLAGFAAACVALALLALPAGAVPARSGSPYEDTFDSTLGIKTFQGTKVQGGSLKLDEGALEDLGAAVPGENVVHSVLGTSLGPNGKDVFCGTGQRGHLVEHDPGELYQEGYLGSSQWGVSNSRGQPWSTSIAPANDSDPYGEKLSILSLATDGTCVYAGTSAGPDGGGDGHLLRFEPFDGVGSQVQREVEDLGTLDGSGYGAVTSLEYDGTIVLIGTEAGDLYGYDPGSGMASVGAGPGGQVTSLAADGANVYGGTSDGDVFRYDGSITDLGQPSGDAVLSVAVEPGNTLYVGTEGGDLYSYDLAAPAGFIDEGQPSGSADPVNALVIDGAGELYVGSENGHLYSFDGSPPFEDEGMPAESGGTPVNALTVSADNVVYGGTGDPDDPGGTGRLFRRGTYTDHGNVDAQGVTGIAKLGGTLYAASGDGDLYSYPGPGVFDHKSTVPDGYAITGIVRKSASLYASTADPDPSSSGHLYEYDDDDETFSECVYAEGPLGDIEAITEYGAYVVIGTEEGLVTRYQANYGTFTDVPGGTLPAGAVNGLAFADFSPSEGILYIAAGDTLYSYVSGEDSWVVEGTPLPGTDIGALGVEVVEIEPYVFEHTVFLGMDNGDVYSYEDDAFSGLGTCSGSVRTTAMGSQGPVMGTSDGRLWFYDGSSLRDGGAVPATDPVETLFYDTSNQNPSRSVFGGTSAGDLFSRSGTYLDDLGQPVKRQAMIYCMTDDPGRGVAYAGTYSNAHFLVIDTANDKVRDRGRPVNGERELEDVIVGEHDSMVYGGTYAGTGEIYNPNGGRLFSMDPSTGEFTDLGEPPAPDETWWVAALAEDPSTGCLYVGTSNSAYGRGSFCSYDPSAAPGSEWSLICQPYSGGPDGQGTRALLYVDGNDSDYVYGGTWNFATKTEGGYLYRYELPGGPFEELGKPDADPAFTSLVSLSYFEDPGTSEGRILGTEDSTDRGAGFSYVFTCDLASEPEFEVQRAPCECGAVPCSSTSPMDGTVWCGTETSNDIGDPHLVNYEPSLGECRDAVTATFYPPYPDQDKVQCVSVTASGAIYGGTLGKKVDNVSGPGHLFRIAPYDTAGGYGDSVAVIPGLRELSLAGAEGVRDSDSIDSLCAGPDAFQYVYGGTDGEGGGDGRLFVYATAAGEVADFGDCGLGRESISALVTGPDGYIYGGTSDSAEDAVFFRFFPVAADPDIEIIDAGIPAGTRGIFSLAVLGESVFIGTGDSPDGGSWHRPRLVEYDTSTGESTDHGEVNATDQGRVNAMTGFTDGKLYGCTGVSAGQGGQPELFRFDPDAGEIVERGVFPGAERSAHCMALGPEGKMYIGTGPSGMVYSSSGEAPVMVDEAGWPYAGTDSPVLSMASAGDSLFGGAGNVARLFGYEQSEGYADAGPLSFDDSGATACTTDNLGRLLFGTAEGTSGCRLMFYHPDYRFEWGVVDYVADTPAGTSLTVGLDDSSGDPITGYEDLPDGTDISGLDSATHPVVLLRGTMSTTDELLTPEVEEWQVTWSGLPGIDGVFPSQAYSGDYICLWGYGFGEDEGTVEFDGVPGTVTNWLDNLVQVRVPQGISTGSVVVRPSGGGESNEAVFDLLGEPTIESLSTTTAHVGDVIDINGSWFLSERGTSQVTFNGRSASDYPSWTDGRITVRVPSGAQTGNVVVNVNGHQSNPKSLTIVGGGGPSVEVTSPDEGATINDALELEAEVRSEDPVQRVDFFVGAEKVGSDTGPPYSCEYDPGSDSDGRREITAVAVDSLGRQGRDSVGVYLNRTVPAASKSWYFAEGCTDYGFETWLMMQNPNDGEAVAHVVFMDEQGEETRAVLDLPPESRTTLNAADIVPSRSLSFEVNSSLDIVCERAMYWNSRIEGHGSIGATSTSDRWYFAEGCTDYGFETWVLLGNPGDRPVDVMLRYMFEEGDVLTRGHTLEPHSRMTVDAAQEVGAREFSLQIDAGGEGIVAERAVYYGGRSCGTGTVGSRKPSTSWFLAEGSTDWGFETWLLLQNPNSTEARAEVTYQKGSGEVETKVYVLQARSRYTVDLSGQVGVADVSTRVESDQPLVCERAMYWNDRAAGHCTVASPGPAAGWLFAEGCTDYGFETWILVDNPTGSDLTAELTFMRSDGTSVPVQLALPAHARTTVDASAYVGSCSFATRVTAGEPVMVERSVYWNARMGGTGSIGAR